MISLIREAYRYAWIHSHDNHTKCGALLTDETRYPIVFGTNRYPTGFDNNKFVIDRDTKLMYIEHAERDVLYFAAKYGIKTKGLTLVAPWACCAECARAIVLCGIKKVVAHQQAFNLTPERWRESTTAGLNVLKAGGVEYELINAKIGYCQNRFDGRVWRP